MPRHQRRDGVWKQCPCPVAVDCVKKHGTWSWEARVGTDPQTGEPIRVYGQGLPRRRDAVDERNRALTTAASGPVVNDRRMTLGDWLDQWYRELTERPEPPEYKTLQGYETNIRILKPVLGHIRLRDLTRAHVAAALTSLGEARDESDRPVGMHGQWVGKRSVSTLERYRATLRRALTIAVEQNLISGNVAAGRFDALERPKAAKAAAAATPRRVWAAHESRKFFEHIADHRWALLYACYGVTGARRAEWLGARWEQLSPAGDSLLVCPSVVTGAGDQPCFVCEGTHRGRRLKSLPKSGNSVRWLPLPTHLQTLLDEHRRKQLHLHTVPWVDHGLIFPDEDGGPLNPDEVTDEFKRLVDEAGLPQLLDGAGRSGVHGLRHNAVSLMLAQGVPVEEVAKITGHDVGTLRRVYAHVIEHYARQSVQNHAEAILGAGWTRKPPPAALITSLFGDA